MFILLRHLFYGILLTNKICINKAIDISNNEIQFNINEDFSDLSIREQILSKNIDSVNIGYNITELKYFPGIELIKTFNIQSQKINKIPDYYFHGSRNIETVTLVKNIVVGASCFEQSTIKNIDFSKVDEIQPNAFRYCFNIKSINLLQPISLGIYSFAYSGLESIILPDSIEIARFCFYSCPNLTSVQFNGRCAINDYSFADCFKLSNVSPSLEFIDSFGSFSFRGCSIKNIKLGKCVLKIGVFQNSNIETVDAIDISFTSKEFRGCRNLRYVNISGNFAKSSSYENDSPPEYYSYYVLNDLNDFLSEYRMYNAPFTAHRYFPYALLFEDCVSLEVFRASYMPDVPESCFRNCLKLIEISIKSQTFGPWAFMNCVSLESINITDVISIGDGCFGGCENLRTVIGIETEKQYGSNVFSDCPKLVVNELIYVGEEMFTMCNSISSVIFKGPLISRGLFMHCLNLVRFECQAEVNAIPDKCFYGCINLVDVILPPSVQSIGNLAFYNTSLKNGFSFQYIRNIGELSFAYSHLKSVTLNETSFDFLQKVNELMTNNNKEDIIYVAPFRKCNEIIKVTFLGASIPMMAYFDECDNIKEIEVLNDELIVEDGVIYSQEKTDLLSFSQLYPYESFTVPDTVQTINYLAFYGTKKLKNLTSNHAIYINISAFMKSSLENIILDDPIEGNYYQSQYGMFGYSKNLKNVVYKSKVASKFDFIYCEKLERVQGEFQQIMTGAFYGCKSLKEIDLKNCVVLFHVSFRDCYSLKRVKFGMQLEFIYRCAFKNCISLEEVIFDQRCKLDTIMPEVFMNCIHLSSVTLPPSLQQISGLAFANTSLPEIRIPPNIHIDSHAFDFCPNIKIVTTAVYEHEYISFQEGNNLVTTLGKQNSTYIVPDGVPYFDPLVLNSNLVFNDTIGAYEKDLGIRTAIIPNSTQQSQVYYSPTVALRSPFIENLCFEGEQIQTIFSYWDIYFSYQFIFQEKLYDPEINEIGMKIDIDGPIPIPTLYAPNLEPGAEKNINIPVVRAPCPNTTKEYEKIYLGSINHKRVYIKNGHVVNSNPNHNSSSEEQSGSQSTSDPNNPFITIYDQNSANTSSKLSTRETIIIAVCASIVVLVVVLAIAYVYMKTKAPDPSDDSDVLEMAEETIQASAGVTFDNPLYMTTGGVSDDPFAKDFQNEDYSDNFYIIQHDEE